jgi:hypothetical protein
MQRKELYSERLNVDAHAVDPGRDRPLRTGPDYPLGRDSKTELIGVKSMSMDRPAARYATQSLRRSRYRSAPLYWLLKIRLRPVWLPRLWAP